MGPMQGAYHTEETHPKLYYTNELPTPSDMFYEEFVLFFVAVLLMQKFLQGAEISA